MSAQRHQIRAKIAHVFTDQEMRIAFGYPHLGLRRQRSETLQGGSKLGHDRVDVALYASIAGSPGGRFGQDWGLASMHHKAFCLICHTQGDTALDKRQVSRQMGKKAVGRECLAVVVPPEPDAHSNERCVPLSCQQIVPATVACGHPRG